MHTGGRRSDWNEHLHGFWYVLLNGGAWRALPGDFGHWFTVYQFFNRFSHAGFFDFLEGKMICGNESEAVFYDSTHIKVHQHSNGPGAPEDKAVGKSKGGLNTRLHLAADILGRLAARPVLTPGTVSDHTAAPELTGGLRDVAGVADKGYDSKAHRDQLRIKTANPVFRPAKM